MLVIAASMTNISCNGLADGMGNASATGGTAPFSYMWNSGDTASTITGLGASDYTVTVTDANGCTGTQTGTVTEPDAITLASIGTDVDCFGSATGSANASASGGTGLFAYVWSNSTSTQLNTNLAAGDYTVTATDDNGCTATTTQTINGPASALTVVIDQVTDESGSGAGDGSISLTAVSYTHLTLPTTSRV